MLTEINLKKQFIWILFFMLLLRDDDVKYVPWVSLYSSGGGIVVITLHRLHDF